MASQKKRPSQNVNYLKTGEDLVTVCGDGALDGSNPTTIDTGLKRCYSFIPVLSRSTAPGLNTSVLTAVIRPNSGVVDVYGWKPTSATDPTLIASTGTDAFYYNADGID